MTDQYIITEELVNQVKKHSAILAARIKLYPYNPQAEQLTENQKTTRILHEATHDYKIQRDEQEKMLKRLEEYIDEFAFEHEGDNGYSETCIGVDHLKKWFIEEFRQNSKDGEQG